MFLVNLWLVAALGAAGPFAPSATADHGEADDPAPPTVTSTRRLPNDVTFARLSNGLTVIIQENHVAPVATVRCFVRNTGGTFEGKYLGAGLSHVLEHVVAGGTTSNRTEEEIEKIIDRFGGATNAFTSASLTCYFIDCPAKDVMTAVDLVADSMQNIVFEQSEYERELEVVQRELADGEVNRGRVQWNLLQQTLYPKHPARHPIIGYLDVLKNTPKEALIDFYRSRYIPNNQVFVVVGAIDTAAVLQEIAKHYTGTPRGRETFIPLPNEAQQLSPREAVREMDGATYDLMLAWPTVKLSHGDLYALDVAAYILSQGDSSRLVRRLKYDEQLVLSVSAASYTPHYVNGAFVVSASTTPQTWQRASDEIKRDVYRLRDELVSPAELAKAKNQKAAELVFGQQTVQQAAQSLGSNYLATGDPLFDKTYVENIRKVTAEQVRDVARRYFVPHRLNRIVIAPPGGAPKVAADAARGTEGEIRSLRLENGLRVLLKRHSHLPMVNLQAYTIGAALVDTPETAGRAALVGAMLDRGTPTRSATEIANYFDSIGGRFSTGAGRFTVYGSATVLKQDFPEAAALFAECLTQPTFPDGEFAKVKTLALGAIARRTASPQAEIFEAFNDALPATSPFHLVQGGKEETVERLTAADLKQYHTDYFVPQNMIVTVFGDVDTDEALAIVKKHFGALKRADGFEPPTFDRPNAIAETTTKHKQTGKPTGMVLLGYPAVSIFDKEDYAALTVLDAMISGYNYPGGWLHNELRGEGLVYYVHALQMSGPAPGFFVVLAQTQPDKIAEVIGRIRKGIARAVAGDFEDAEFELAKEMIVALHAQANTTISSQAQQAALDELYGLGYDFDRTFDARINAVTREDVARVARKYLSGKYVKVTSSPQESP
jgi:zinc protease